MRAHRLDEQNFAQAARDGLGPWAPCIDLCLDPVQGRHQPGNRSSLLGRNVQGWWQRRQEGIGAWTLQKKPAANQCRRGAVTAMFEITVGAAWLLCKKFIQPARWRARRVTNRVCASIGQNNQI